MSNLLTENQQIASQLINVPMAVRASAGSGKTSTLVARYIHLLRQGYLPRNILCVTFTNEAADQLRSRILDRVLELGLDSSLYEEVEGTRNIGTLHGLCYSILNQYGDELGLPPVSEVVDAFMFSDSFHRFYREWLEKLPEQSLASLLEYFNHKELKEVALEIYRNHTLFFESIALAQDARATDQGAAVLLLLGDLVRPLVDSLNQHFHRRGAYSFDDLENLALKILRSSTVARTRLSSEFKQILLDEFQDTSTTQWQIVRLLLGDNFNKLFFVGDPKQSIYGFRGAEPSLFEEVTQLVIARNGTQVDLSFNFRTQGLLLKYLNQLGSHLFHNNRFSWVDMIPINSSNTDTKGPSFKLIYFGTGEKTTRKELQEQEPQIVFPHIREIINAGANPSTIAILFRNADRIDPYSRFFQEQGIATHCKSTDSLSKQLEANEIISFLRFLTEPTHDAPLVAFLRSQYIGWSYQQILSLAQKRHQSEGKFEPLYFTLQRESASELGWVFDLLDSGSTAISFCLEQLFFHTRRFPNDKGLLDALLKPLSRPGLSLFDSDSFLSSFSEGDFLFQKESTPDNQQNAIQLMTVHASKGLEFDHVFLVDTVRQVPSDSPALLLKPGLPPGIRFWDKNKKVTSSSYQGILEERKLRDSEEARRILYVAITRARTSLTCFVPTPDSIAYPKNSWADLLTQDWDGRDSEEVASSLPTPFEVSTT